MFETLSTKLMKMKKKKLLIQTLKRKQIWLDCPFFGGFGVLNYPYFGCFGVLDDLSIVCILNNLCNRFPVHVNHEFYFLHLLLFPLIFFHYNLYFVFSFQFFMRSHFWHVCLSLCMDTIRQCMTWLNPFGCCFASGVVC